MNRRRCSQPARWLVTQPFSGMGASGGRDPLVGAKFAVRNFGAEEVPCLPRQSVEVQSDHMLNDNPKMLG